jgi:hypothetical protein
MGWVVNNHQSIIDDLLSIPSILNGLSSANVVYTPDGSYGVKLPRNTLDLIYNTINETIPYGNYVNYGIFENITMFLGSMPNWVIDHTVFQSDLEYARSNYKYVMGVAYGDAINHDMRIYASNYEFNVRNQNGTLYIAYDKPLWKSYIYHTLYNNVHNTYVSQSGAGGVTSGQTVVYISPISMVSYNSNYVLPSGINYSKWLPQVGGDYAFKIPTKEVLDPNTDTYIRIIDDYHDIIESNQDTRIQELTYDYLDSVPVTDVQPYNPTKPEVPLLTDPFAELQPEKFLDRLISKLVDLFILPEGYFIDRFNEIKNSIPLLSFPLQIINDLERIARVGPGVLDDITVDYIDGGHYTIVSFQALRDNLPTFHNWVRAIIFILLLFYNFDQVYKLINGNSYGFGSHQSGTGLTVRKGD